MLSNVPLDTLPNVDNERLENLLKTMEAETERLANELADAKQKHQAIQKKLDAAEALAKNQSVPSTANPSPPPFPIRKKDLTLYHSPNSQNEQQGVDLTTANELAAAQTSLIGAKVRLNPTSQTHTPKY